MLLTTPPSEQAEAHQNPHCWWDSQANEEICDRPHPTHTSTPTPEPTDTPTPEPTDTPTPKPTNTPTPKPTNTPTPELTDTPTPEPTDTPTPEPTDTPTPTNTPVPYGELEVSRTTIDVGEVTNVTVKNLRPPDLEVTVVPSHTGRLIDARRQCPNGSSGQARSGGIVYGQTYRFRGCTPGQATIELQQVSNNGVLESVDITVTSVLPTPPTVEFSAPSYSVNEGSSRDITVNLSRTSSRELTIPIEVAQSSDYSISGLTSDDKISFSSGETSKSFTINTNEDSDCSDETVNLGFGTLPSGVSLGSPSSATLTIHDDDTCVRFSSSSYSVTEGSSRAITVRLSRTSSQSLTIPIEVAQSSDYSISGLTSDDKISFSSGETSKSFTINTNEDSDCSDETVNLGFGTLPSGVSEGSTSSATLTIDDNDSCPPPTPTPTNVPPTFGDGANTTREVEENKPAGEDVGTAVSATDPDNVTLTYSLAGGTGLDGTDLPTVLSAFEIDNDDGQLTTRVPLNHEDTPSYVFRVQVTDGKDSDGNTDDGIDADILVIIEVINVDELGSVSLSPTPPQVGTPTTATLSDQDGGVTNLSWQWQSSPDGSIWNNISGATESSYMPASGDEGKQIRASVSYDDAHGTGKHAASPAVEVVRAKLATPTNLDVTPSPLRKATLSWTSVVSATAYVVEIQALGGTWEPSHTKTVSVSAPTTSYEIELDDILSGKGLADAPYAYEFRVKATDSSGAYEDSEYSDTVIIIDTPITKANGDSRDAAPIPQDTDTGLAALEWTPIRSILGPSYAGGTPSFRYRKLGGTHSSDGWQPMIIDTDETTTNNPVTGLEIEKIYAIQLRYETATQPTQRVYAGRDAYVWPSKRVPKTWLSAEEPYIRDLVATFPLNPILPKISNTPTYSYRICESTFPSDEREDWRNLIRHALDQWELATGGLVVLTNESYDDGQSKPCSSYAHFVDEIADGVKALDPSTTEETEEYVRGLLEKFRVVHIDMDPANPLLTDVQERDSELNEIQMFDDMDEDIIYLWEEGVFPELSDDLGYAWC